MVRRTVEEKIIAISKKVPVITITGPRQSGKTTLVRSIFPNHTYINLEHLDNYQFATDNTTGFFFISFQLNFG